MYLEPRLEPRQHPAYRTRAALQGRVQRHDGGLLAQVGDLIHKRDLRSQK